MTVWIPTTSAQSDHLQQDSNIKLIRGEGREEFKKKSDVWEHIDSSQFLIQAQFECSSLEIWIFNFTKRVGSKLSIWCTVSLKSELSLLK